MMVTCEFRLEALAGDFVLDLIVWPALGAGFYNYVWRSFRFSGSNFRNATSLSLDVVYPCSLSDSFGIDFMRIYSLAKADKLLFNDQALTGILWP